MNNPRYIGLQSVTDELECQLVEIRQKAGNPERCKMPSVVVFSDEKETVEDVIADLAKRRRRAFYATTSFFLAVLIWFLIRH